MNRGFDWLKIVALCVGISASALAAAPSTGEKSEERKVPLKFTGGYETEGRDRGRPVVLIAAALKVPDDVFRETFTNVKPARGGPPDPEQVRKNKASLMKGLSPYGVTNDRLDEVSNYYRYNGPKGEMWRNTPAEGYATLKNGAVTSITITKGGAGYSSVPKVSVPGVSSVELKANLTFGTEFEKNGSVKEVVIVPAGGKPTTAPTTRPAKK